MSDRDLIGGIVFILWGLSSIIWHKRFGRGAVRAQHRLLNVRLDERGFQVMYLVTGVAFVVIGVAVIVFSR